MTEKLEPLSGLQFIGYLLLVSYTNHIKYLISSEPHRHLNPRRIDAEMVFPFKSMQHGSGMPVWLAEGG